MADWFRSWHGAPTDPKWLGIARKAGVAPGIAVAVAWALMDRASQADNRGSIAGYDADGLSCFFGCEPEQVEAIVAAMGEKGIIRDGRLTNWEKRQPKREDDSAGRVREHRDRERAKRAAERIGEPAEDDEESTQPVTQPKRPAPHPERGATQVKRPVAQPKRPVTPRNAPETDTETEAEAEGRGDSSSLRSSESIDRTRGSAEEPRAAPSAELDDLVDRLVTAARGNVVHGSTGIEIVKPILDLIAQGVDLERDILPTVAERVPPMSSPLKTWGARWLRDAMLERHATRLRSRGARASDDEPLAWEPPAGFPEGWPRCIPVHEVEHAYKRWLMGSWPSGWGGEPGTQTCKLPPAVVDEWMARRERETAA